MIACRKGVVGGENRKYETKSSLFFTSGGLEMKLYLILVTVLRLYV